MGTYQVLHVHNFNNCKGFYFINIRAIIFVNSYKYNNEILFNVVFKSTALTFAIIEKKQ